MSRHEGVRCDFCLNINFQCSRYKCLICYDYDLCANCYEDGIISSSHVVEHPMQCILTRSNFDLFYGGEITNSHQPQSFTCPMCSKSGYTDTALYEHVIAEHTESIYEVLCPVCAAMPDGDSNLVTDDFARHLTIEHRLGNRDSISFLDEPSAIRHGGVRRISNSGRLISGSRSGRRTNNNGLSAIYPVGRDPASEILFQLTSGRLGSASTYLQQLQTQIQLERLQIASARQQLERLPRLSMGYKSQFSVTSSGNGVAVASAVPPQPNQSETIGTSSSAMVANNPQFLLNRLMETTKKENIEIGTDNDMRTQFIINLLLSIMAKQPEKCKNTGMVEIKQPLIKKLETATNTVPVEIEIKTIDDGLSTLLLQSPPPLSSQPRSFTIPLKKLTSANVKLNSDFHIMNKRSSTAACGGGSGGQHSVADGFGLPINKNLELKTTVGTKKKAGSNTHSMNTPQSDEPR